MDEQLKVKLNKVAPRLAAATPSKASAVWTVFKSMFFPLLPGLLKLAVERSKTKKDEAILRAVRDVLNDADL